jgi:predicted nucleic acid-binding protein
MNGEYALDTNIVIALLDEEPAATSLAAKATTSITTNPPK